MKNLPVDLENTEKHVGLIFVKHKLSRERRRFKSLLSASSANEQRARGRAKAGCGSAW